MYSFPYGLPLGLVTDHADAPPVGLDDTSRFPIGSAAAHIEVDGHEIDMFPTAGSTLLARHELGAAGSVDVSTSPLPATATQNVDEGQEMPVAPPEAIAAYGVHCIVLAAWLGAAVAHSAASAQAKETRIRDPR